MSEATLAYAKYMHALASPARDVEATLDKLISVPDLNNLTVDEMRTILNTSKVTIHALLLALTSQAELVLTASDNIDNIIPPE
jgi:hypothetical protein